MSDNDTIHILDYGKVNDLQALLGFTCEQLFNVVYGRARIATKDICVNGERKVTVGQYITQEQYLTLKRLSLWHACGIGIDGIYEALSERETKEKISYLDKYFTDEPVSILREDPALERRLFMINVLSKTPASRRSVSSETTLAATEVDINDIFNAGKFPGSAGSGSDSALLSVKEDEAVFEWNQ